MPGFGDLFERLDPDPNVRGIQFEHICKWYLKNDPTYRRILRQVWLWKEWPGNDGRDIGIDLVAEDWQGHLWAIQAKADHPDYRVKKREIDSFLAASSTEDFSFRLLMATTDLIGANALREIETQDRPIHLHMRTDLERAEVDWPADPSDLRAPLPPKKSPRKHQQEAIDAVAGGFESHDRGQMIMACGTGKTLTALWITENLASNRTLVLVPSLSLLKDTLREWTAQAQTNFSFLPVCSDLTVRGSDEWVSSTTELGFPVTTEPDEIADFLVQDGAAVVFSTYQSSPRIAEAQSSDSVPEFDLVIADEAHRVTGPVSSDFAAILDNSSIRAARRLFTTATPRFFTNHIRKIAGEADFELASMDDGDKFGPVFHRLPFGEAIERDLLSDYQVAIIGVDDPTFRRMAEDGVFVKRDGTEVTDARTLASHIGLAKAMHDFNLRKTISFHSRINKAREFAADFRDVVKWMPDDQTPDGELITSHVSGKMTASQRDTLIKQLDRLGRHQRGLLSNARCLGEGIDVPTLDGVAFIDPRNSPIDIIQAVGRAIRKTEDKSVGTIVLPVFIATTEDPDTVLSSSAFQPIWSVLKALRSHDDDLAEQLDEYRRTIGRIGSGSKLPSKLHIDLPTTIGQGFAHAFEVRLVERSTASWEFWYGLLEAYEEREGNTLVPLDHVEADHKLGIWVNSQRASHRGGSLDPDRVERLESLKGWSWNPQQEMWERAFALLEGYEAREGDTLVPSNHVEAGYQLGPWVNNQRALYRRGAVDPDRVERLESLKGWSWNPRPEMWERAFALLKAYAHENGTSRIPQAHIENGFGLGAWVASQRGAYWQDKLETNLATRLEALPKWSWDPDADEWWETLTLLSSFVKREGHCRVPRSPFEEEGVRLGDWAVTQRRSYKRGRLAADQIEALEAVPGWSWDPKDQAWNDAFALLEQYVADKGDALVPRSHKVDGFGLGSWVSGQRSRYKARKLDDERAALLSALPAWSWDPVKDLWEMGFNQLKGYVERNGDANVPSHHKQDGYQLGTWIDSQRSAFKKGKLSSDRVDRLRELGLDLRGRSGAWDRNYEVLEQYVKNKGHARVPSEHSEGQLKLGRWVVKQRAKRRGGRLSTERIRRLEALPGWTWNTRNGD